MSERGRMAWRWVWWAVFELTRRGAYAGGTSLDTAVYYAGLAVKGIR